MVALERVALRERPTPGPCTCPSRACSEAARSSTRERFVALHFTTNSLFGSVQGRLNNVRSGSQADLRQPDRNVRHVPITAIARPFRTHWQPASFIGESATGIVVVFLSQLGTTMKLPRRKFLHLAASVAALPVVSQIATAQTTDTDRYACRER
jgi:hypothetical protein